MGKIPALGENNPSLKTVTNRRTFTPLSSSPRQCQWHPILVTVTTQSSPTHCQAFPWEQCRRNQVPRITTLMKQRLWD